MVCRHIWESSMVHVTKVLVPTGSHRNQHEPSTRKDQSYVRNSFLPQDLASHPCPIPLSSKWDLGGRWGCSSRWTIPPRLQAEEETAAPTLEARVTLLHLVTQSTQLFVTPLTVTLQAALSMGILQARILEWGCHGFLQGIFPTQGSNPGLPLVGSFFTIWATRKAWKSIKLNRSLWILFSYSSRIGKVIAMLHRWSLWLEKAINV